MITKFVKQHLEVKITILFCVVVFCTTFVASGVVLYYGLRDVKQRSIQNLEYMVRERGDYLNKQISRIETMISVLSEENSELFKIMCSDETDHVSLYHNYVDARELIRNYMDTCLGDNGTSKDYFATLYGASDLSISRLYPKHRYESWEGVDILSESYIIDKNWYQTVKNNYDDILWLGINEQGFLYGALDLCQYISNSGYIQINNAGVFVFGFQCEDIIQGFSDNGIEVFSKVAIISESGTILYSSSEGPNEEYLLEYELDNGIKLLYDIPFGVIYDTLWEYLLILILIVLIFLVTGIGIVRKITTTMIRPIVELCDCMRKNESSTHDNLNRIDEVGQIYQAYNQMLSDLKVAETKKIRTEVKLLQAQINPHFIYNALDTIGCGVIEAGEDELAMCVANLTDFMRYNLRNPDRYVILSEELSMLRKYIDIRKLQSSYDIDYTEHVWQACLSMYMPKMLIQPLLENALEHGGKNHKRGTSFRLALEIKFEDDKLLVCVRNEGNISNLENIRRHLEKSENISEKKSGLGICNVNDRIQGLFGNNYGLSFENVGEDTCAILILPVLYENIDDVE